jgi:hypothetical protein
MAKIGSLFIGICWEIWRNRNEDIFQNIKKDNWASVNSILSYHSSLINVLVRHEDHPVLRNVRWHPLTDECIKVNVTNVIWIHGLFVVCVVQHLICLPDYHHLARPSVGVGPWSQVYYFGI